MQGAERQLRFGSLRYQNRHCVKDPLMKHFIFAAACAAVAALAMGSAHAQSLSYAGAPSFRERPAPPTEPSIPIV
jgi:hypothetical protein